MRVYYKKSFAILFKEKAKGEQHDEQKSTENCGWENERRAAAQPDPATTSPISINSLQDLTVPIIPKHMNVEPNSSDSTVYDVDDLSPTSDSYTVPGSSGTMKETHIFTPIKPNIEQKSTTTASNDDAFVNNSIIINESVVRKEYHDIDYDSSKLSAGFDEFSEFQSMSATLPTINDIPPAKYQPNTIQTISCDEKNHQTNIINDHFLSEFDTLAASKSDEATENALPKLQKELPELPPTIINNHINSMDFEIFEKSPSWSTTINGKTNTEPIVNSSDVFSISSSFAASATLDSQSTSLDFKPAKALNNNSAAVTVQHTDNFGILIPQSVYSAPLAPSTVKTEINWAEPSTDSQQIDDDEWSDFVSVAQPQTPITHILNQNLLKQQTNTTDEDDWSEFVSSTAPPSIGSIEPNNFLHQQQQQQLAQNPCSMHTNMNDMNHIFNANHSTAMYPNMKFNVPHNHHNNHHQPTISSSIISLPDLRFVAPKSLVNMPTRTLTKK